MPSEDSRNRWRVFVQGQPRIHRRSFVSVLISVLISVLMVDILSFPDTEQGEIEAKEYALSLVDIKLVYLLSPLVDKAYRRQ